MDLQPHMVCYAGNRQLIEHVILSNLGIFIAYMLISACILFVAARKIVPNLGLFYGFTTFIALCGFTHLLHAISVFTPKTFWIEAIVGDLTAIVSLTVAGLLIYQLPQLLAFWRTKQEAQVIDQEKYLDVESLANINKSFLDQNTARINSSMIAGPKKGGVYG